MNEPLILLIAIIFLLFGIAFIPRKKNQYLFNRSDKELLRIITQNKFQTRKLMNKSEYLLFIQLEKLIHSFPANKYRLFSQVSLGEILSVENEQAFRLINSKRVDFLIINAFGDPIMVIEYQGSGHYQNNAKLRDAIKKNACEKAGISYIEFPAKYGDPELNLVIKTLNNYH